MSLILDLLRHGAAELHDPGGDAARPLTAAGERDLAELGARLGREGWRPERAFTSALRRAVDTVRIVTGAAGVDPPVKRISALSPNGFPGDVVESLKAHGIASGHVLLVGHQPLLGDLAAALGGRTVPFPPGGLARIELPGGLRDGGGFIVRTLEPGRPD